MLTEFKKFVEKYHLIEKDDRILLALSGGVDSMVLAKLLILCQHPKNDIQLAFAHCNFHLRGDDSNRDENFVRHFAKENDIPIYIKHFDTETYAKENSISIEMAARELRYSWFEDLKEINNFTKVALAHHGDDQIETFFINLLRGSGINGLKGMKVQNGFYIRPLLFSNRNQIESFAKKNNIHWVEDYTNQENVYLRNKIRNQLMPFFDEIKDSARQSIRFSVDCLTSENELYRSLIEEKLSQIENVDGDYRYIENRFFLEDKNGRQILFEWVRRFGFNYEQSESMYNAMINGKSGVLFYSPVETMCTSSVQNENEKAKMKVETMCTSSVQRDRIEIFKNREKEEEYCLLWPQGHVELETCMLRFSVLDKDENFRLEKDASKFAQFDMDKISFPLKFRHWRKGDKFKPLGMKGSKLMSDFFNDMNFSTYQKQNTWIMEDSNGLILWVVGYRISDKVKITDATKVIFQCDLKT